MVQLRLWRRPLLPAGHVGIGAAATVGEAPSDAGEDGECERGQGDLRAAGGGGAQHRRTQALQPAQRQGNRPTLPGDHGILQDHRCRPEAEAGFDPTRKEERGEARIPCLTQLNQSSIHSPFSSLLASSEYLNQTLDQLTSVEFQHVLYGYDG